jgi:hypothetical protein
MASLVKTYWRKVVIGLGLLLFAAAVVALGWWLLWWLPRWQAADVVLTPNDPNARVTAENELRRTMATVVAGTVVFLTGLAAWRNLAIARATLAITREGQITERFTKAIEQLGATDDKGQPRLEIRLGGIYALERIARDSCRGDLPPPERCRDHGPIMEVLTAYVRQNAPARLVRADQVEETDAESSTDVRAVLTVIGRRTLEQRKSETRPLDLAGRHLRGAKLGRAHLERADLSWAGLHGADLSWAHLNDANLSSAEFSYADLSNANLTWAHLTNADLSNANLNIAYFAGTDLAGAHLNEANLAGADLAAAQGLTQAQVDSAITDEYTRLPLSLLLTSTPTPGTPAPDPGDG